MGKATKWFKKLFTRNKDKEKEKKPISKPYSFTESKIFTRSTSLRVQPPDPESSPKLKRGGSFRLIPPPDVPTVKPVEHHVAVESWIEQKKVVAAAVAVAKAKLVGAVAYRRSRVVEEAAAVTIQSVFRSYLARKALKALVGVVRLQALVRGYLVRKETTAALKCLQSLAMAEARARTDQRMAEESKSSYRVQHNHRKSEDWRSRQATYDQEIDWGMDENIRIMKMDARESRRSPSGRSFSGHPAQTPPTHIRPSKAPPSNRAYSKQEHRDISTKQSAQASPGSRSMRFDNRYFDTAPSIPEYSDMDVNSTSEYSDYPKTYQRVFTNCAYSMQERQDLSLQSGLTAESARFDDYSLDNNTQSSSDASSYTTSVPEYPFYEQSTVAPAYVENAQPSGPKLVRSRSAPRTGADSIAGMWGGKKFPSSPQVGKKFPMSPQVGTGPDWNVDSWSAKRTPVGGSGGAGKKRNYGSSPTSRRSTVNGNPAVQGNRY